MARNLVICCDGTENEIGTDRSNVLRLFEVAVKNDDQRVFYDTGVGTVSDLHFNARPVKWFTRSLDTLTGFQISERVLAAYRFLIRNYQPGDRIYLFGFSRGAYTVRALAGMIHDFGILKPDHENLMTIVWSRYANDDSVEGDDFKETRDERNRRYFITAHRTRKDCSHPSPIIHFLGCWDTVSSFGSFFRFKFLRNTRHNSIVTTTRHAMALDERRAFFKANHFSPDQPDCKEVWFPGVHSDIGGGYPESQAGLAKDPFDWMTNEAIAAGLSVDSSKRATLFPRGKEPDNVYFQIHKSLHGKLWVCEFLPYRDFNPAIKRLDCRPPNFARRRKVFAQVVNETTTLLPLVHVSVQDRKNDPVFHYKPPNLPAQVTWVPR